MDRDPHDGEDTVTGVVKEVKAVSGSAVGGGASAVATAEKNADAFCALYPEAGMVSFVLVVVVGGSGSGSGGGGVFFLIIFDYHFYSNPVGGCDDGDDGGDCRCILLSSMFGQRVPDPYLLYFHLIPSTCLVVLVGYG